MSTNTVVVIVVLILIFGGGGWGWSRYGAGVSPGYGIGGLLVTILLVWLVLHLLLRVI